MMEKDTQGGRDVVIERDIMVPMRDKIRLATDLHRPARQGWAEAGSFPVILERTPYDKTGTQLSERTALDATPLDRTRVAAYFVRHGYIVVYQDCRGRYNSEGRFVKYLNEAEDGYDTVEWIRRQPWCNGRIGTMGLSYSAHAQSALACLNPKGLCCMLLDSGGFSNAHQGGIRQGGAFELKQATWAFKHARLSRYVRNHPEAKAGIGAEDIREWFHRMPWAPGRSPLKWVPEYENFLFDQWTHGTFDDFWQQPGIYAEGCYEGFSDVPMLFISSWYDTYVRSATDNYMALAARKQGPVRLLMGPWIHGHRSITYAGDADFGKEATLDDNLAENYLDFRRQWFDCWLKGEKNDVAQAPPVRIFVMGGGTGSKTSTGRMDHGGHWKSAPHWPLPETVFTSYFLHNDGQLSTTPPAAKAAPLHYTYDPTDPVPTIGGAITSGQPVMEGGAFDQREAERFFGCRQPNRSLAERPDVLTFQTEPLPHDVEVTGPISVTLWISSSCPDTDFTAKLIDLYPPNEDYPEGYAMNITAGILRVRYRNDWSKPEMMEPGKVYEIKIEPFATSNRFMAGHCIRLDISSSNFPHFDINPNTGEPEGLSTRQAVAENRVYLDAARPSRIVLPVIP